MIQLQDAISIGTGPPVGYQGRLSGLCAKSISGYNHLRYLGVQHDHTRVFRRKDRVFRVITYQAIDAQGLIGPEHNGIAILMERPVRRMVCVGIGREQNGYFGISLNQYLLWCDLAFYFSWNAFNDYVVAQLYHGDLN